MLSTSTTMAQTDTTGDEAEVEEVVEETALPEPEIFRMVEKLPEFPGGTAAQQRFVSEHFKIPKEVRDSGGVIRIYVQFTVDTSGCVRDITVRGNKLTPSLEKAGKDVVSKMKCLWSPGVQGDRKVRVRMTQPITVRVD